MEDKHKQDLENNKKTDVIIVDFECEENGYYKYRFLLTKKIDSGDKMSEIYDAILKIVNS
ncbi:MAG: hypothetical protein IPJ81_06550 [Chitinophagaceae bacterium]|nr:hypothetical protein [Chitinophagaceae bacterium]